MIPAKITPKHLKRTAYVYIRQSTLSQVRDNLESRRRQYELADRARSLGWSQVEVVDEDLGRSGSGRVVRPGFQRLLSAVCLEDVGGCSPSKPRAWPATTGTGTTWSTCAD